MQCTAHMHRHASTSYLPSCSSNRCSSSMGHWLSRDCSARGLAVFPSSRLPVSSRRVASTRQRGRGGEAGDECTKNSQKQYKACISRFGSLALASVRLRNDARQDKA
eukprot:1159786-Pelagomonas_calceolata.AAC.5